MSCREAKNLEARHYDWIMEYATYRTHLLPLLKTSDSILMVGCGNSSKITRYKDSVLHVLGLSEDLYEEGFRNITNTDYSASVIDIMRAKTAESCPLMKWEVADMRNMDMIPSDSFDIVLDKCAMDAIWSDGGSLWDPEEKTVSDITSCVKEFHRVLKPGGTFIFISFGQPHFRKPLLSCIGWDIKTVEIGMYFMYVMNKS